MPSCLAPAVQALKQYTYSRIGHCDHECATAGGATGSHKWALPRRNAIIIEEQMAGAWMRM